MQLRWASKALSNLGRLHDFLSQTNAKSADRTVKALASAPHTLLVNPRIGERLPQFGTIEARRILVKQYEIRYEIKDSWITILRIWHTKEHR
jgi:plasmid stabilization system protein ParE